MPSTEGAIAYCLRNVKFKVLSLDFVQRVEEPQPIPVKRKRVHYILYKPHIA